MFLETNSYSVLIQYQFRCLERADQVGQEGGSHGAIHQAVVGTECQVHDGSDGNGVIFVHDHRLASDCADGQDGGLGWVDDGSERADAEHAQIGDGEGASSHFLRGECARAGLRGQIAQVLVDAGEGKLVRGLDNRDDGPSSSAVATPMLTSCKSWILSSCKVAFR